MAAFPLRCAASALHAGLIGNFSGSISGRQTLPVTAYIAQINGVTEKRRVNLSKLDTALKG